MCELVGEVFSFTEKRHAPSLTPTLPVQRLKLKGTRYFLALKIARRRTTVEQPLEPLVDSPQPHPKHELW